MGRSNMQGTPWHYEYISGKRNSNSKRCVYNVGYCSHKYSQYYRQECEGRAYCEDFDRSDFVTTDLNQNKNSNKKKSTKNQPTKVQINKNESIKPLVYYKEYPVKDGSVKLGDKISVINCSTRSSISFNISNPEDPFIGKKIGQTVELKSANYKITKIIRKCAYQS